MNQHQHRGVTFQQVFQCLSREGWFSQWGMSGMSYFKPGTVVGTAVFNQNVFVGEANVEMYWRHSGDWQRVERMIFQAQLNNQMHQNQINQQRQHHQLQQHMAAVASMPRGMPMPQQSQLPPTTSSSATLPSAAELMDQRARSLNYPLDMLCDILAVDRDTPNGQARQRQARQQLQQQQLQQHHLSGMHAMGDPSRFTMLDPSHASSILFPQSMGPTSAMHLIPSHMPPPSAPAAAPSGSSLPALAGTSSTDGQELLLVEPPATAPGVPNAAALSEAETSAEKDASAAPATKPPPAKPKKRSRNLYIRLDQMKTVLRKHGWKWVEGPKGFIYCKPHVQVANRGKTMSGKDGVDYFSGRQPFEAYVRSQKALMELIQNDLKEKHGGAIFSMEIPPEDQLCAPTYKERAELARRKLMKEKRMAALALRRSQQAAASTDAPSPATSTDAAPSTHPQTAASDVAAASGPPVERATDTPLETIAPTTPTRTDTNEEASAHEASALDEDTSGLGDGALPSSLDLTSTLPAAVVL